MKYPIGIPIIAMSLVSACAAEASNDAIRLRFVIPNWGKTTDMRILPSGRVEDRGTYTGDRDVGTVMTDYARFASLVEPMRRYAGKTMPCGDHIPDAAEIARNPLAAMGTPVMATLDWEATGQTVRLNLACRQAPPELASLKNALDLLKRAANDPGAAPLDAGNGAARRPAEMRI